MFNFEYIIELYNLFILQFCNMMKLFFFSVLVFASQALPLEDQIVLANSLIVGKDNFSDLYNWDCVVCDATTKPLHAHPVEDSSKDVKCIFSVYRDMIVLAFRYTNTVLNVWEDILYPIQVQDQHTCKGCKVQKAYNNMWDQIQQQVLVDLAALIKQTRITKLHITGISLGGGLASIAFIDINHANLFKQIQVTTFGAPMVGNKDWVAQFDLLTQGKTIRFVVNGDPIPNLPVCLTPLCTYRQPGIEIVCNEDLNVCVQSKQIPKQDDDEIMNFALNRIKQLISHKINHKKENLQSIIDHINGYPRIYNMTLTV